MRGGGKRGIKVGEKEGGEVGSPWEEETNQEIGHRGADVERIPYVDGFTG